MTLTVIAAGLAAAIGAAAAPAHHSGAASERVTLAQWTQRVEQALDQQIAYPRFVAAQDLSGTVRVKFNCSESGRPAKVGVDKSSGSGVLDRAAVQAVQRIVSLHPPPTGMRPDQKYVAVVMFGTSDDQDWRRAQLKMRTAAREQSSWFKDAPEPTADRLP